jgi:isocitrate dehydrogenase
MVSNRGVKVYPGGFDETFLSDNWRCRFHSASGREAPVSHPQVVALLKRVADAGLDFVKIESLCHFDGQRAYSLDQGE